MARIAEVRVDLSPVRDAYEKGFQDGVTETLSQIKTRFDLTQIDGLQDFVGEVEAKVEADRR
jgi:hypothetical protein